jgi:hypothetical protein
MRLFQAEGVSLSFLCTFIFPPSLQLGTNSRGFFHAYTFVFIYLRADKIKAELCFPAGLFYIHYSHQPAVNTENVLCLRKRCFLKMRFARRCVRDKNNFARASSRLLSGLKL